MRAIFKLLFYSALFFVPFASFATEYTNVSAPVEVRRPAASKIEKFRSGHEFQYETDYSAKISLGEVIMRWLNRHFFAPILGKHAVTIWQMIEYSLAILAIILIVYYFIKSDRRSLFSRDARKLSLDMEGEEEDINLMDFDKLINEAIGNGQYRVAIRYLYLRVLKDLADNNLINWKAEKTNRDYINELRPSAYGKQFMEVTLLFDYAWYGDAFINESNFGQIKKIFLEFDNQLRNR